MPVSHREPAEPVVGERLSLSDDRLAFMAPSLAVAIGLALPEED